MPDVSLDNLQIEIGAKATKANDAIDGLIVKLDRLTTSIGGLNKSNFTGFSVGVNNVSKAMQGLSNVKLPDYTRLAKGIEKFSTINAGQIQSAGMAMQELGKSLRMIDGVNVSDNATQLASLAKGISQLGYKSATQAVQNIPKLAIAMRELMATLSTAPRVSQNIIDMTNALAKLARTGASSGRASASLAKSLDLYTASSKRASKATWSLASAFGKMYASYWLIFRAFRQIRKAINISSDLTEIQNVVDVTFGDMSHKVEQFAETSIEQFGMSELTLKKVASTFQAMGSAMNISNKSIANANEYLNKQTDGYAELGNSMADVSLTLTKLTADMASFYNVEQDVVSEDLQSIFTGQSKPLRQYGIDITEVNLKQWAMTQGLNSNIEAMTQAEKVMLRYQYVLAHTGASQGDFSRTVNTWANQVRILKQNFQQLGAIIGGTFINMLKPLVKALNSAMSSIIAFAQTVSNALGKIFGWQYEVGNGGITSDLESGADYADDLSDSMGSASDNAKKLKSYLLGIDELNVLEPQQNTSGSGGSGAGAGAGGVGDDGGQWVKTDGLFADYESEIDSLYKLGDYISQTLSRMMESIDWDSVYQKARGFGRGLADFLNGLISPRLFGNVGKTISNSLNTALEFLNSFGETFDFYEFGESIAWGIRDFFDNFDFTLLAETLNTWVDGFKDFIKGFLNTITWDSILEGGKDFLGALELDTISVILGGIAIKYGGKILTSAIFRKALTNKFKKLAEELGTSQATKTVAGSLGGKLMAGFAIGATIYVGFEFVKDFSEWKKNIDELGWDEGRRKTAVDNQANPYIDDSAYNQKVDEMVEKWRSFWDDVRLEAQNNEANPYIEDSAYNQKIDEMKEKWDLFRSNMASNNMANPYIETSNYNKNIDEMNQKWEESKQYISGKMEEIMKNISQSWDNVKTNTSKFLSNIGTNIIEKWQEIKDGISEKIENIRIKISQTWENIKLKTVEIYTEIRNKIQTTWNNIKEKITTTAKSIYDYVSEKFEAIKTSVENAMKKASDAVNTFRTAISNAINKISEFLGWNNREFNIKLPTDVFRNFSEKVSGAIDRLKEFFGFDGRSVSVSTNVSGGGSVRGYATGGFPQKYSLFMAGEDGIPEIAGTVGGRTAVAGGAEITGIRDAVYSTGQAETALLQTAVQLLQIIADKDPSINVDGRSLVSAYDERKIRNGYAF